MCSIPFFLIFIFIAFLGLLKWYNTTYSYWKLRKVPFINPLPLFGSAFPLCVGKLSIGSLFYNVYNVSDGAYQGFFVFHRPWLLLRNIDLIKSVFVKDFDYFTDRSQAQNPLDDEIAANCLFGLRGTQWKYIRNKMTPVLSLARVKKFYPIINNNGNQMLCNFDALHAESNKVDMRTVAAKFVTDVLTKFSFGIEARSFQEENSNFFNVGRLIHNANFFRSVQMTAYSLAPFLVNIFRMKLLHPAAALFLRNVFWDVFHKAEDNPAVGGDLIQYLTKLQKENEPLDFLFDGDKLVAQSVQFFVAGLDTTSLTITYALYELSINSEIQDRVRNEITSYSTNWKNISYEELNEMHYLDMVINETLRKYPAFPFLDRVCVKEYRLPGTDVVIPVGNTVCVSLLGLHYDPQHFPDPHTFDPERFSKQKGSRLAGCFMPFSTGPRICIGERLARIIIKLAISKILSVYNVELAEKRSVEFSTKTLAIAPLEGIHLKFKKV